MRLQSCAPCRTAGTAAPITCAPRRALAARGASAPPVAAAPLGSTVSVDDIELPKGFKAPKQASKDGKVLHPDLINPNILKTQ